MSQDLTLASPQAPCSFLISTISTVIDMITKLTQKHVLKGSREFEIVGDEVRYEIKSSLKTESLSVVLYILNSEPVISGSMLSFVSTINQEPLVELFLNKPDKETFDRFVSTLSRRIIEEDFSRLSVSDKCVDVDIEQLSISIEMLQTYLNPGEIGALLDALSELKAKPDDMKCLGKVADAFNDLGFEQGQVLTYAPYINFLLSRVDEDASHKDTYE